MKLDDYNARLKRMEKCYEDTIVIAQNFNNTLISDALNQSLRELRYDKFNLVVVGEFSRGKSTFINALMGKRLLPSATKPTTTVINRICYGPEAEFYLHFRDDEEIKRLSEEEFKTITAVIEPSSDDNDEIEQYKNHLNFMRSISHAEIRYPVDLCKEGIEIIDTPGTNDLDQAREEITFNFIPQSDVAILVLSATQILSLSEVMFLRDRILDKDIRKCFFVVNFKDRLESVEDQVRVLEYVKEHLCKITYDPKIFLVSSKDALNYKRNISGEVVKGKIVESYCETGFEELENEISLFLINESGRIKLEKHLNRLNKRIELLIKHEIKFKLDNVDVPLKQLESKLYNLKMELVKKEHFYNEVVHDLETTLYNLEAEILDKYRSGLEDIAAEAGIAVLNYEGALEIDSIKSCIENVVAPMQKKFHSEIERFKSNAIDREMVKAQRRIKNYCTNISFNVSNSIVPVGSMNESKVLILTNGPNEDSIDIDESSALGLGLAAISFTITFPFVAIPLIFLGIKHFIGNKRQKFIREVKDQVDQRYGEIIAGQIMAYQKSYRNSINQVIQAIRDPIITDIEMEKNQLNHALDEKNKTETEAANEKAYLTACHSKLLSICKDAQEVIA